MNENQYRQLCVACDELLLSDSATLATVSIPLLHVLSEQPAILKDYESLFVEHGESDSSSGISENFGSSPSGILSRLCRKIYQLGRAQFRRRPLLPQVDVVVFSHLINIDHAQHDTDFYFGSLIEALVEKEVRVLLVLIDHINYIGELSRDNSNPFLHRMILRNELSFIDVFKFGLPLLWERRRLSRYAKTFKDSFKRDLTDFIARRTHTGILNLKIHAQISRLVRQTAAKAILTTHEGHSFERMAYSAACRVNPRIVRIAYQHTILFRLQHAIMRNLGAEFNPNIIYTSGAYACKELNNKLAFFGIKIELLGTDRAISKNDFCSASGDAVLVLPENIPGESTKLFLFALEAAELDKNIRYLFRPPPMENMEALVESSPLFRKLPDNVSWSNGELHDDISQSCWVVHRASSAAFLAVARGCFPIYIERSNTISINPFYPLNPLIRSVKSPGELVRLLQSESRDVREIQNRLPELLTPINIKPFVDTVLSVLKS